MKKILTILIILFVFIACKKNVGSDEAFLNEKVDTVTAVVAVNTMPGNFISNGQNVSGVAKIYDNNGKYSLSLENFSTNNGPDLHVYLAKEMFPLNFIDLGKLRSTSGNLIYEIKGTPDFTEYKYVLIHCQQYNHLFGSAQLTK